MAAAFTETHHALLFGWLAQAVIARVGQEQGEGIVRDAVRRYGEERGRRMALRAQLNGHALTPASYLAYGEWSASPGSASMEVIAKAPDLIDRVHRCAWHSAWEAEGLMRYGRLYCMEIDRALMRGFNPELVLEVNGTLSDSAPYCEFVFRGARLSGLRLVQYLYRKRFRPGKAAVMPWSYHLGHLFTTMEAVIVAALGKLGEEAIAAGLDAFRQRYGEQATEEILAFRGVDFGALPQ